MPPEPLDEAAIRAGLSSAAAACLTELRIHPTIDSTNAELARRGRPATGAHVCLAEQQTAGRGRRGRTWKSPPGGNVYASVAWTFGGTPDALAGLSLAVGVVLCETLEALGVRGVGLKWPNDVQRDGRKLAGVLVELLDGGSHGTAAIVGMGLNVALPPEDSASIDQPWADLHDQALPRNDLVSGYLNRLLPLLETYTSTGFSPWKGPWEQRHVHAGRAVRVEQGGREIAGTAAGVDARGALLLATTAGTVPIQGGEVSLRPLP